MYRAAEDFKSSPYGIKVVKDYVLTFGEPPDDLRAWVQGTDWIRDEVLEEWNRCRGTGSATRAQGTQERLNVGKEDVAFFSPREDVGCTDKTILDQRLRERKSRLKNNGGLKTYSIYIYTL